MFTTKEIPPSPFLAPYVRCYALRQVDTSGFDILLPTQARHEIVLTFHFKDKLVKLIDDNGARNLNEGFGGVVGLFTQPNGHVLFNGKYSFLEIVFKPNGFHKIFRLPVKEITNQLIFSHEIFGPEINFLYEQLCEANDLYEMGFLANAYLLLHLTKQKQFDDKDRITGISNLIVKSKGNISVEQLAYHANMSLRTFERNFINQVGASPKLFCSMTRFNNAVELMLKNPSMNWTVIANASGYFDQMHLIKAFKKFAGFSPTTYQKQSPLAKENYITRVDF